MKASAYRAKATQRGKAVRPAKPQPPQTAGTEPEGGKPVNGKPTVPPTDWAKSRTDYRLTTRRGVKIRVRLESLDKSAFLVADVLDGPWLLQNEGLAELATQIREIMSAQPANAWVRFYSTGLYSHTTPEVATQLLDALTYVWEDETCSGVLGMDPTLDPIVPYDPEENSPLRDSVAPLEAD